MNVLLESGEALRREGYAIAARRVLEYVYTHALGVREFSAANFLGLAEVRLQSGDTSGAMAVLRRMTIVGQNAFDALAPAAELLERYGKAAEALEFWRARHAVAPWDSTAAVAIAKAASDENALRRLAASSEIPYAARVRAAGSITAGAPLGSAELDLMTAGATPTLAAVERPLFYFARIRIAESTKDLVLRLRLLREALEIDPAANPTRLAVFRAAVAANRPVAAIGSVHGLTGESPEWSAAPTAIQRYQAEAFLQTLNLPDGERARIAMELAEANRKLGRLESSVYFLRMAARLNSTVKVAPQIASAMAELERAKQNRERMPVVSDGVAQPHRVRPRIAVQKRGARV